MDDSDCKDRFDKLDQSIKGLHDILNGHDGVVTQVALHEQRLNDQPSPATIKFNASIGGGVIMVLSLIGLAVVQLFTGGIIPD